MDIKTYIVPLKRSFYFHRIPRIIKILRNEKIHLIHTHDMTSGNIQVRIAAFLCNIPCIPHIHVENFFSRNLFKRMLVKTLDNITARVCKHIIAVSQSVKYKLIKQGYPKRKMEVIYNFIDTDTPFRGLDKESVLRSLGIKLNTKVFLHIGRLCPNKGQEDLLKALRFIQNEKNDICCLFAGEDVERRGAYREKLDGMVKLYGLDKFVKILGFRKDIESLINVSDAVVLPSYIEGLPLVALEAMKNKKPFIGYAVGGIPEIIENGRNGYLVKKGDTKALRQALMAIIGDALKSKKMGEEGFKILKEKFNPEIQKNRILDIYRNYIK